MMPANAALDDPRESPHEPPEQGPAGQGHPAGGASRLRPTASGRVDAVLDRMTPTDMRSALVRFASVAPEEFRAALQSLPDDHARFLLGVLGQSARPPALGGEPPLMLSPVGFPSPDTS